MNNKGIEGRKKHIKTEAHCVSHKYEGNTTNTTTNVQMYKQHRIKMDHKICILPKKQKQGIR